MFSVPDVLVGGVAALGLVYLINLVRNKTAKPPIVEQRPPAQPEPPKGCQLPPEPQTSSPSHLNLEERKLAGKAGEDRVAKELSKLNDNHRVLHDITIHFEDWDYQIDHLVISNNTIFILETKNYAGRTLFRQNNLGKWERPNMVGAKALSNPFQQLKKRCTIVRRIIKDETSWFANIQPIAVLCNKVELDNINSNIPMISPKEVPCYIENYYYSNAIPQNIQFKIYDLMKSILEGEKFTKVESQ